MYFSIKQEKFLQNYTTSVIGGTKGPNNHAAQYGISNVNHTLTCYCGPSVFRWVVPISEHPTIKTPQVANLQRANCHYKAKLKLATMQRYWGPISP